MKTLFFSSPLFMGVLTLILIILFVWFIYNSISISKSIQNRKQYSDKLKHLKSIGLFALVIGVLHQLIAWHNILYEIEQAGDITPGLVISALKTTMIPLIYGLSIFLLSLILWAIGNLLNNYKKTDS